ncbi:MAG: hypothetical protein K8R23_11970 [Chthoniobacter sp.]|nr:hypothetical protein [Chthoniobacter sp.]
METNLPEEQSSTEPPLETPAPAAGPTESLPTDDAGPDTARAEADLSPTDEALPGGEAGDELTGLAEASQRARLAPAQEERMTALLKEALLGGRAGVARAVDTLPKVPWIVGVRAIEQVWPELTAGFRTQLIAGLGKEETDAARRMRLSVARALFKVDAPVALKVVVAVVREMRDKDSGGFTAKDGQIFSNVLIGRGNPWVAQLALAELKPVEAEALVYCGVMSAFTLPHPPVTQLGMVKWAQANGGLDKLAAEALDAVTKGVARWSSKWQSALRREVVELPEQIAAVLKPVDAEHESNGESSKVTEHGRDEAGENSDEEADEREQDENSDEGGADDAAPPAPKKERPVYEPRPQKPPQPQEPRRESPRERPVYEPRNGGGGSSGGGRFDLASALRQIDQHVQGLRNELAAAKSRPRDEERRAKRVEKGPIIEGSPTPDELARLNLQLEARNAELQTQITELTQHSEDVATSTGAMAGEPVSDTGAQLRTLLALKLQEDYADFLALEKESNDLVVQQHYKGLIRHVFEVLQQLEVPLKIETETPAP